MSPATIYRWLEPGYEFNPSATKLRAIARAFGIPPPLDGFEPVTGFSDGDIEPMEPGDHFEGLPVAPNQGRWRVQSRVLELAGLLPGDVVLADSTITPMRGDVVVVQIIDMQTGSARTRLRQYQPPYVMTATMDQKAFEQPLFVDNERVRIWGTMVKSLRVRAAC